MAISVLKPNSIHDCQDKSEAIDEFPRSSCPVERLLGVKLSDSRIDTVSSRLSHLDIIRTYGATTCLGNSKHARSSSPEMTGVSQAARQINA